MGRVFLLALAAALAAASCGGGGGGEAGPKTFDDEAFAITFQYPASFEELEDVSIGSTAGAASKETRALGLNEQNVILVDRYDLRIEVTQENLADVKPEVDRVVSQAAGQELSGEEIEIGGCPGTSTSSTWRIPRTRAPGFSSCSTGRPSTRSTASRRRRSGTKSMPPVSW